jgi:hypothetical protein
MRTGGTLAEDMSDFLLWECDFRRLNIDIGSVG